MFKSKPELIEKYKQYQLAFNKKGTNSLALPFSIEAYESIEEANGKSRGLVTF